MNSVSNNNDRYQLSNSALFVSFQSNIPIPKSEVQKILEIFRNTSPDELSARADYDDDNKVFLLGNDADDSEQEIILRMSEVGGSLQIVWGPSVDAKRVQTLLENVVKALDENFPLFLGSLKLIEFKKYFDVNIQANHYDLITKSFFSESPIAAIFSSNERFDNDIAVRGIIDQDRVLMIRVIGGSSLNEVKEQEFKDKRLRVIIGLGQLSGIVSKNLFDQVLGNIEMWEKLYEDRIQTNIIDVINEQLKQLSRA